MLVLFFGMSAGRYRGCVEWRGRELLYISDIGDGVSRVMGFSDGAGGREPVPLRHQRNCRAFLRGYDRDVGKKVIFDGPSRV